MDVLIGSKAIKWHFPDFPREPKDMDYASTHYDKPYVNRGGYPVVEYYPIPPLTKLFNPLTRDMKIATPSQLLTLKLSHIFWDIKWNKTMFDIVWLTKKGVGVDWPLFHELYDHWVVTHGEAKRADLAMSVDEFFTNGIKDGHKHDELHTFIKAVPSYTMILREPDGVEVSEHKFFSLTNKEDMLNIIREECYVMAYERGVGSGKKDYRDGYAEQLKQWILVHAPTLNMAVFGVLHYDELRKPVINYKEVIEYGKANI
jgi:hypothetical protein